MGMVRFDLGSSFHSQNGEMTSMKLDDSDLKHLDAAEGWLGLGDWQEANEEWEQITPAVRSHSRALNVRWAICAKAAKWDEAIKIARLLAETYPRNGLGWVHWAYSLHELKRTEEAQKILLGVLDKFSKDATVQYNLACYACCLGHLETAMARLVEAFKLTGEEELRSAALDDPDLKPLWRQIGKLRSE
jgi:tetratricopeptide (TPR) repeat protein